jgi:hypothetical protein
MARRRGGFWFERSEDVDELREEIRRLTTLVVDLQTAPRVDDSQPNAPFLLQVATLGAILGNPLLREKGIALEFIDADLSAAASELETAKGRQAWPAVRRVLETMGVEWNERDQPAKRMIRRMKLDAQTSRVLQYLHIAAYQLSLGTDETKKRFIEIVASAGQALGLKPEKGETANGNANSATTELDPKNRTDRRPA